LIRLFLCHRGVVKATLHNVPANKIDISSGLSSTEKLIEDEGQLEEQEEETGEITTNQVF
jgi:hypothetical protein